MVTATPPSPETGESEPLSILIVDNDQPHATAVAESLERVGHDCTVATSGPAAAELIEHNRYDLVFTDLVMPGVDGMEVLRRCKHSLPDTEVIVVTGHGTVSSAVEAMQQGAFTYVEKGAGVEHLRTITSRAAEAQALRRANAELHRRLDEKFGFEGVIGNSRQMHDVIEKLKRIAPTDASVLIQGATGTGKELVAQAIHQNSPRKNKPFVALNCAALSEHILESELFGHVKGAFTDASADRVGKFEYADGGTLFLDEVGDMPMPTQIKLLRVLESSEITRVGSNEPIQVNVRILSATNRDLAEFIEEGLFRSDLYHRLKVVTVVLPRLTDRAQDIPLLTDYFMKQFAGRHKKKIKSMAMAARRRLIGYDWPGNVRQLRNVIESMVVVDHDGVLGLDDLPEELAENFTDLREASGEASSGSSFSGLLGKPLVDVEKLFISETLNLVGGNREEAAKILGIGQRTLYRKIKEFQL
ncbi:MAG: response regulator [Planctomycetales bacterium]|nr:response regulator [Planctomycetales bacterium]